MGGRSRAIRSVLTVAFILTFVNCAIAKRLIPDDNLAYPVLVTLKSGGRSVATGSGFYLNTGDETYLVTAKHVIAVGLPDPSNGNRIEIPDLTVELLSYSKDLPIPSRVVLLLDFKTLQAGGNVKVHRTRDVAVIKVATTAKRDDGSFQVNPITGAAVLETSRSGIAMAPMESIRKFDDVLVGNDAILYGYPASLGLPKNPQFDALRPLLRKALIAGQDPQRRFLIIDGPVYKGNSGGPVVEIDVDYPLTHYYVVGVLTQFIPLTEQTPDQLVTIILNSGYSIAEPMDYVLELVGKN
jgi:S1-C subfamily serine protease